MKKVKRLKKEEEESYEEKARQLVVEKFDPIFHQPILYSTSFHRYEEYQYNLTHYVARKFANGGWNCQGKELLVRLFMNGIIPPEKFASTFEVLSKVLPSELKIDDIFRGFIQLEEFPVPDKETYTYIWNTPLIYPTCLNLRNLFPDGFLPRSFTENGYSHPLFYIFEMKSCYPRDFIHSEIRYIHVFVYVCWHYFKALPLLKQEPDATVRAKFYRENLTVLLTGVKTKTLKECLSHYQEKVTDYVQDFETKVEQDPEFVAIFHALLTI